MDEKLEAKNPTMRPGMSHVVHGGERLVIRDSEGQEIEFVGRENDKVMSFLVAFDNLREAQDAKIEGQVTEMLRSEVITAWRNLPAHVVSELPSYRKLTTAV